MGHRRDAVLARLRSDVKPLLLELAKGPATPVDVGMALLFFAAEWAWSAGITRKGLVSFATARFDSLERP